jgi:Ca-activated chloride channel homolog
MGTFAVGEHKTFLLRLELPASPVGERPIASATFTYDDLGAGQGQGECFGELALQMTPAAREVSALDAIVLSRLSRSETARTLQQANALFEQGRVPEAQAAVDEHLRELDERRKQAGSLSNIAGFFSPFERDLDAEFEAQAGVLKSANTGFAAAAAAPEPAPASREGKVQVRRNATKADAFAL